MSGDDALHARARSRLERLLAEDADLRSALPSPEAHAAIAACTSSLDAMARAFELYADRACLAERMPGGPYRVLRYREVWSRVVAFASGLVHEQLAEPGAFIGICGFGSVDWAIADLACAYLAAVSAPLQTGLGPIELKRIIQQAELRCIVCSEEQRAAIEAVLPDCPSVRALVVLDATEATPRSARTMASVERIGRERGIVPGVQPSARGESDPLMTLLYTSGSSGTPKAAMYRESRVHAQWRGRGFASLDRGLPRLPYIALNYMPLNHGAGRGMMTHAFAIGGATYFVAKSDMSTLYDDARLARPTTMMLVPRVAGAIHQRFQAEVVRRARDGGDRAGIERALLEEMASSLLGDRLLMILLGTAPTPPEVVAFLERCFQVPVLDGYGSTEAGGITFDNRVIPNAGITWKLVDVPELGYRTSDRPYPRGELHIKSPLAVPGYYKDERATRELFDAEGYVNTGDIFEQRGADTLVWLGRSKEVLKLAQGEFVAPVRLEGAYASQSPFIRQIYIHGDGFHAYLLAVVVPDAEAVAGVARDDAAVKQLLRAELDRVARELKLRPHEVPRDLLIEREPFRVENGLLTDSNKQSRPRLAARYRTRLEAMFAEIERAQVEDLYSLGGPLAQAPIAERVLKAMAVTLGLPDLGGADSNQSFINLGGDSLSATGLATLIEQLTGVDVPVGFLLDPTSSVRGVVDYVERAGASKARGELTFAEVHGDGATVIRATDIRIEAFLDAETIARAHHVRRELPRRAEVALLTGADGYLGRHLVLELLERLAGAKKVFALVRATDDAAARERLAGRYRTDPRLQERFEAVAANLTVLAGDLIAPQLRLEDDVWARLADEVDLIVHNGALVNHALGYEQVFEPNVLGTVRLLRLALARRLKSMAYVSTVGVVLGLGRAGVVREDEDLRALVPERAIGAGYAAGYATSKWVCELLLGDANAKLGVPVSVFRPSELMVHSEYRGQVNVPDFFTRLVAGIVYTGLAPKSFYAPGVSERVRQFDGLPVDVVARSIAAPAVNREPGAPFRTYHVTNPRHGDGASLDDVVGWVRSAGYPVERVVDYGEWYRRFHDRLAALGEKERGRSPLAILQAWSRPAGERGETVVDNGRLVARLRAIDRELAELPAIDEAIIHKMLEDMAMLGVIPPAPLQATFETLEADQPRV